MIVSRTESETLMNRILKSKTFVMNNPSKNESQKIQSEKRKKKTSDEWGEERNETEMVETSEEV